MRNAARSQMTGAPSIRTHMANITKDKAPNDLGIFQDTIIKPRWNELPSPLTHPLRRLRIELKCMSTSIRSLLTTFYLYKFAQKKDPITGKRKRMPLLLRERFGIARDSQKRLYTALAQGDLKTIEELACNGLEKQLRARVEQRKERGARPEEWDIQYRGITPPSGLWWILQTLIPSKSVKIISDRVTSLPFGEDALMRQLIVRIHSKQRLATKGAIAGEPAKDVTEYLVLNQSIFDNEDQGWRVWGTTQPTTDEQFDQIFKNQGNGGSLWENIKSRLGSNVGNNTSAF